MSNLNSKVTEDQADSFDLLELMREKVFDQPLLPQVQVLYYFNALDDSLQSTIDSLLSKSNFVETYLTDVVAEVAASVTHGRTIYGKTVSTRRKKGDPEPEPAPAGTPHEVFKRSSDIQFLEQSINIIRMLAFYTDKDPSEVVDQKNQTRRVLSEIKFVRLVYEEVIEKFLDVTDGYADIAREAVDAHNLMHDTRRKGDFSAAVNSWSDLHTKMASIEAELHVDRAYLYHLRLEAEKKREKQEKLRNTIYHPYLRIVYKEAKRHATNKSQVLDNFQNGALGLTRAISCYNLDRNVSFSSYAHWWVRQSILFHIKDSSNFVKLPVTTWQTYTAVEKKRSKILAEHGVDDMDRLFEETGHSKKKLEEVYNAVRSSHVHSLDYEVDETGKMRLIDVIPDAATEERERLEEVSQDVESRLDSLEPDQRWVMHLHYGMVGKLNHSRSMSEQDIMRERIRQRLAASDRENFLA